VGPGGGEPDKPFSRIFFKVDSLRGLPEKDLIYWGAKRRKKCAKNPECLRDPPWKLLNPTRQGVGLIFFFFFFTSRGRRKEASHLLRGAIRTFFKGVDGPKFRPKAGTDDVSYTCFSRENFPFK
jgi:hypothetical protein